MNDLPEGRTIFKEKYFEKITENSPVGMRTAKTALSIFICLLVYQIGQLLGLANTTDAFLACVTAVICLRDSVDASLQMGLHRLLGTFIGAVLGLLYLSFNQYVHNPYLNMFFISLGIIVVITACNLIGYPEAVVISCVVFLLIAMGQVESHPVINSAKRFADTAIGLAVAYLVNRFVLNPDKRSIPSDDEMADDRTSDEGTATEGARDASMANESVADDGTEKEKNRQSSDKV